MNITINLLEVASDLAHEIVCAKFEDNEDLIYRDKNAESTEYTENAQDLFNEWYDIYYDKLLNYKI